MKTENNEKRCIANQIILDLFHAGETGQIQILMMACHLSLKQLAPQDLLKAAESLLAIIPNKDGERLDFLEAEARKSRTGISLDFVNHVEAGQVLERGFRYMRYHHISKPYKTAREAIDAEIKSSHPEALEQKEGE